MLKGHYYIIFVNCPRQFQLGFWSLPRHFKEFFIYQIHYLFAISFSRRSSRPRIKPKSPAPQAVSLPSEPPGKPPLTYLHICIIQIHVYKYKTMSSSEYLQFYFPLFCMYMGCINLHYYQSLKKYYTFNFCQSYKKNGTSVQFVCVCVCVCLYFYYK